MLFYEGPRARAYLETMHQLGIKPQKIIQLVSALDLQTKKRVGKFLPLTLRLGYASSKQQRQIHYWPQYLEKKYPEDIANIRLEIKTKWLFNQDAMKRAQTILPLTDYSDCVELLLIDNLKDPALLQQLEKEQTDTFLFTGGGIVPSNLLAMANKKLIHVHPGFLPDIRGADCTLWSILLEGQASSTAFFLSPGIDEGDILKACWLPSFTPLKTNISMTNIDKYRVVYSFIDPWVRAFTLKHCLVEMSEGNTIKPQPQSPEDGMLFHFMEDTIKTAALGRLFIE